MTKTKIAMALFFLGLVVIVRYAMRDMELDLDILRDGLLNMPGMVMENMRLKREISGDIWSVTLPYVERRDSIVTIRSLDIQRKIKDGGEWYFFGREGFYYEKEKSAVFNHLLGTLEFANNNAQTDSRVMNLESPLVTWTAPEAAASGDKDKLVNEIVFPEGLSLYDQEFLITATVASMDTEGVILFNDGGSIQWTKPIDWDSSLYPDDLDLDLDLDLELEDLK